MRLRITSNMKEEAKKIGRLPDDIKSNLVNAMQEALTSVAVISASEYLQGPRPKRLGIFSGKLIRAVMAGYSFSGSGGNSDGSSDSIRSIFRSGDEVIGIIGVREFKPFDYPSYWEHTGRGGTDKRPFMEPAGKQAQSRGLIDRAFQSAIDKVEHD